MEIFGAIKLSRKKRSAGIGKDHVLLFSRCEMNRSQSIRQMRRAANANTEHWNFINRVYDDLKTGLLALIIIGAMFLLFRYFVITEYGSFEKWWNSGSQGVENKK